jgi:hypothetical protein
MMVNVHHFSAGMPRVKWVRSSANPELRLRASAGIEVERQWRAQPETRLPTSLGDWRSLDERSLVLLDRYFDTPDFQLDATRSRLRLRRSSGTTVATLKRNVGTADGLRQRIEIEGPCDADPEASVPFVAARLLTLDPLEEIGRIRTQRVARLYGCGERLVEVSTDQVAYRTGPDEWRVEAEGAASDVTELSQLLEARVAGLKPVRRGKVQTMLHRRAA